MKTSNEYLINLTKMNTMSLFKKTSLWALLIISLATTSCTNNDDEVPEEENDLEVITDVTLVFTNVENNQDVVRAQAQDPDGIGVEALEILGPIHLDGNKTYTLTLEIMNNLEDPGESITEEIEEEDQEHQLFFGFSNDAFSDPMGDGNMDNTADQINYNDTDANGNPVGLSTNWSTEESQVSSGTFTVRLQHQPDLKTASSGATDGDTDFELQFVLNIQ
jgi:hypothetical protein